MNYGDYGRLSILTNFKIKYGKDIFLLRIVCESDVKSVLLVSYTAVQSWCCYPILLCILMRRGDRLKIYLE